MRSFRQAVKAAAFSTAALTLVLAAAPACARHADEQTYHLPAQPLAASLRAVSTASETSIAAPADLVEGRTAPALDGAYTPEAAVAVLLVGSGLRARPLGDGLVIERSTAAPPIAHERESANQILVTGSRIRGAPVASPVLIISGEAIRDAGQADLGEVARSVPQSFGGGQNPGVGFNVPSSVGGNVGGGSSFNLRGLGSDATLTILNGHRLPYDSGRQGVDISAIPLAAVDRIEVVADGSSALYGSDAVGGVGNVILRQSFDGVETRARLGGSTAGGDFQQQYGLIAGHTWTTGGGFAAYEYSENTAIQARDRAYAASRPGLTLFPESRRHAVAASVHQQLADDVRIEADALYNERKGTIVYPLNFAGDLALSRTVQAQASTTAALAASLIWSPGAWRLELTGTYGKSRAKSRGDTFIDDAFARTAGSRYDNRSVTGEIAADGPLFRLPGGDVQLALGAGTRSNQFALFRGAGAIQNIDAGQDILYGYGELGVPLVSPDQHVALVRRLHLSGAVRYERYRGIAGVVTPKIGAIYSPSVAFDLKGTWGRSFRAPSFYQQYQLTQTLLYPVTVFGGSGFPAGSTALLVVGGNPALKPEKATSWSATVALHPPSLSGATLEVSYFSTRYIDRIVNPIPLLAQALSNPTYRDQITYAPAPGLQAAIISGAEQFINVTGGAYDPAAVVALVDSVNVNAGHQSVCGVDALLRYRTEVAGGSLGLTLDASYLESEQRLAPGQSLQTLAGILFNPPHWRARGALSWDNGPFALTATVSHIGGVTDPRTTPAVRVEGMTTADMTARYQSGSGPFRGIEFTLTVQNIFGDHPSTIATSVYYDTPYDSTNYSPVGRFVAVGLAKKW
jgi:outer membrane receptor protein involved in Fe transport